MNYDDINQKLAEIMMEEKRFAYDAGALGMMDTIITLCEMSGGRLNTRQLRDYKTYVTSKLERNNGEEAGAQQMDDKEADTPVRFVTRGTDPQVVELSGEESSVGFGVPQEEQEPEAGQDGEAVTQAESS